MILFGIVFERHGNDIYWTATERGEEHRGQSRGPSLEEAGRAVDEYFRFLKLGRYWKAKREAKAG
jgi:hypothetical protein